MRCLNASGLEIHAGGQWRSCDPAGGRILLTPCADEAAGSIICPFGIWLFR